MENQEELSPRPKIRKEIFLGILVLILATLACSNPSTLPAQYVYFEAGTDHPKPTDTMEPDSNCMATLAAMMRVTPDEDNCREPGGRPTYTPYPTPTPYRKKYTYYKTQNVNLNGIVLTFEDATQVSKGGNSYWALLFSIRNNQSTEVTIPYLYTGLIRDVNTGSSGTITKNTADTYAVEVVKDLMEGNPYLDEYGFFTLPSGGSSQFYTVIRVTQGSSGDSFQMDTDPLSSDALGFIQFIPVLPPDRCPTTQPAGVNGCAYHAETSPGDYPVKDTPVYAQMQAEGAVPAASGSSGSSAHQYNAESFDVGNQEMFYQGPASSMMPLAKYSYLSQHYGCTDYCYYNIPTYGCSESIPRCGGKDSWDFHTGVDFAATTGTALYAVKDSTVTFTGCSGNCSEGKDGGYGYGELTVLSDGEYCYYYAHQSAKASYIAQSYRLSKGQMIGKVGNTGGSSGPHLHFEVRRMAGGACAPYGASGSVNPERALGLVP